MLPSETPLTSEEVEAFRDAIDSAIVELSAELRELERSDAQRRTWHSVREAAAGRMASDRLSALLGLAARDVPYYARCLRATHAGVTPPLSAFPVLTKPLLRAHFADLIRRDGLDRSLPRATYYLVQTSGSTGQPVTTLKTAEEDGWMDAVLRERLCSEYGVPLRGEIFDVGLHEEETPLVELRIDSRPLIAWNLRPYEPMKTQVAAEYELVAGRRSPVLIQGTTSRVVALARLSARRGWRLRPAVAVCAYEHLSEATRTLIADAFDCPVVSLYGTTETGVSAWECRNGRLHFEPDAVLAEIVDAADRPVEAGEVGRLLLTCLKGTAMPIIRYDTGDRARWAAGACSCGRPGPAVHGLEGRSCVMLVGRSGAEQQPYRLTALIEQGGVVDFQVVQDAAGEVRIVVPAESTLDEHALIRGLHAQLRELERDDFDIVLDRSGEFVRTRSGKRNPVVSRLL